MVIHTLLEAIGSCVPAGATVLITRPPENHTADFATSAALAAAKVCNTPPKDIAEAICQKLQNLPEVENAVIAGNGFVNITLTPDALVAAAHQATQPLPQTSKKYVVEFGQENIAKPQSVGHLRSNVIGQALAHLLTFNGHTVVTDNHLGDWGTQFGCLIVALELWGDTAAIAASESPVSELNALYVRFHEAAEKDDTLKEKARQAFVRIEQKDPKARSTWQWICEISLKEFKKSYARLGSSFDAMHGESFFEDRLEEVIGTCLSSGVAQKSEDGSVAIFNDALADTPLLIQKSDGATLYSTRDLATVQFYVEHYKPDVVLQCTGAEQSLYFKQMYAAAQKVGFMKNTTFVHITNGLVRLPEGKMSTRKGRVVRLHDVFDAAVKKAAALLEEKSPDITHSQRAELAESIGIGSVKFADLGRRRESDIVFRWDDMLSLDGYSAPFIMYAHARLQRLIEKTETDATPDPLLLEQPDRALLAEVALLPVSCKRAITTYHPHVVARQLFDIATCMSHWYHAVPVLKAAPAARALRCALAASTAHALKKGLELLGIAAPNRM